MTPELDQLELIPGVRPHETLRTLPSLSRVQREILGKLHADGHITSTEAGVLMHRARRPFPDGSTRCGFGAKGGASGPNAVSCCGYASADGLEAMKRLERRGLVVRDPAGGWAAS